MKKWTIGQLAKKAQQNNLPLLSENSADFWNEYMLNFEVYDRAFARLFKSFFYFDEEESATLEDTLTAFTTAVDELLTLHAKRYSEVFQVHVLSDSAYDLVTNYDMIEKMDRDTSSDKGSRSDSYSDTQGAQTTTLNNSTSTYDSDAMHPTTRNEQNIGAQTNNGSATSGAQHDTATEDYTLTRKGNIGVVSAPDLLEKHLGFWSKFDFYNYVFKDICAELLEVNTYDY